jgi:uncharacterized cysteine cluster protein YcgN (CxxCxxCC family)
VEGVTLDETKADAVETVPIVPGRGCGGCALCCKIMRIEELDKPKGAWCRHCAPNRAGCTIYDSRPQECRTFHCAWLTLAQLGPEWQPTRARMVLSFEAQGKRIVVHVDPGTPAAWRADPYLGQIRQWAKAAVDHAGQVVVHVRDRAIVILPNKEVDVGTFAPGDFIVVRERATASGRDFDAYKVAAGEAAAADRTAARPGR